MVPQGCLGLPEASGCLGQEDRCDGWARREGTATHPLGPPPQAPEGVTRSRRLTSSEPCPSLCKSQIYKVPRVPDLSLPTQLLQRPPCRATRKPVLAWSQAPSASDSAAAPQESESNT